MSFIPSLFLKSLLRTLSFTLMSHIHLTNFSSEIEIEKYFETEESKTEI